MKTVTLHIEKKEQAGECRYRGYFLTIPFKTGWHKTEQDVLDEVMFELGECLGQPKLE